MDIIGDVAEEAYYAIKLAKKALKAPKPRKAKAVKTPKTQPKIPVSRPTRS